MRSSHLHHRNLTKRAAANHANELKVGAADAQFENTVDKRPRPVQEFGNVLFATQIGGRELGVQQFEHVQQRFVGKALDLGVGSALNEKRYSRDNCELFKAALSGI